jgi:hypothetical protein
LIWKAQKFVIGSLPEAPRLLLKERIITTNARRHHSRNLYVSALGYTDLYMSIEDRAAGAVMGALVGDALGVGPHWYYDLEEMRRDYGEWVDNYTNPMPHRYHAGLKAGQLSQAGIITVMLLRSVVTTGDYDESDFCRRLDEELFPQLDGKPVSGPGGYTSQSIREAWRRRVEQKKSWRETGARADTPKLPSELSF